MVRLRILLMKYCLKPLRYSACLMVLFVVSGCSHHSLPTTLFNFLSFSHLFQSMNVQANEQSLLANVQSLPELSTDGTESTDSALPAAGLPTKEEPDSMAKSDERKSSEQVKPEYSFALQLVAVNSEKNLAITFKKMKALAPEVFQGKPLLNVEVADVNQNTYYRLKFGGYKYLKNATADCEAIKRQGLDCWVSNYTDNRIYL